MSFKSKRFLQAGFALIFLSIAGCSSPAPPEGVPLTPSAGAAISGSGRLEYSIPQGWIEQVPSSAMRKAEFLLPSVREGVEDAELAVFVFPGGGGTVQANIDRWIAQFSKADGSSAKDQAKVLRRTAGGLAVTVVDVSGSYNPGMAAPMAGGGTTPRPDYRLLGAIVETKGDPWFFKLTGPRQTVDQWEESFDTFLQSIHSAE